MSALNYTVSDVSRDLATRAHSGTSFVPERRADQAVQSYLTQMRAIDAEFSVYITDDNRDALTADLEDYRQRYVQKLTAYWGAHSRVVSAFIAGPSG